MALSRASSNMRVGGRISGLEVMSTKVRGPLLALPFPLCSTLTEAVVVDDSVDRKVLGLGALRFDLKIRSISADAWKSQAMEDGRPAACGASIPSNGHEAAPAVTTTTAATGAAPRLILPARSSLSRATRMTIP